MDPVTIILSVALTIGAVIVAIMNLRTKETCKKDQRKEPVFSKDMAKALQRDFIPGGSRVNINTLEFRRTNQNEILQCCKLSSYDPQSGPIYCGDIAEYVAFVEEQDEIVGACQRHKPPDHLIK